MRKLVAVLMSLATLPLLSACSGASDGPAGLYLMTRYAFGSLETAAFRFEDGIVVRNPVRTPDEVDEERAQRPSDVGSYRLDGDMLTIELDGSPVEARFEDEDEQCFGWDGASYCPVQPFDDGAELDGTFEGGASVGGGAVMSSTTVTFRPDGSYELSSIGSINVDTATESVSAGSTAAERGRYRIDGTALTLEPEGGDPRVYSVFPYDDGSEGPAPRRMYFGGGMLKRSD